MDLLTLYIMIMLPKLAGMFEIFGLLGLILGLFFYSTSKIDDAPWHDAVSKKVVIIPAILLAISLPIPSNKQMIYLVGGYVATNVENVEKLPKNLVGAANKFLEDYVEAEPKK